MSVVQQKEDLDHLCKMVNHLKNKTVNWNAKVNREFDFIKVALPDELKGVVAAIISTAEYLLITEHLHPVAHLEDSLSYATDCKVEPVKYSDDYVERVIHVGHGRIHYGRRKDFVYTDHLAGKQPVHRR